MHRGLRSSALAAEVSPPRYADDTAAVRVTTIS
jgi:hypothetical protein